ncbi:hypothetical protein SH501x_001151 [Pirellulaceae bacterium SH501]
MTRKEEKTIYADVIEARCIRLVDESGHVSVELSTSKVDDGLRVTVIQIFDDNGMPRLELQVSKDEAGIRIIDKSDKAKILLATRKDGSGMSLQNAEGSLSIVAAVANDTERDPGGNRQRPRLELHDHTAKESLYIQDDMQ